jgi:hypothetical protein
MGGNVKLELKRKWFTDKSTVGELWVDNVWQCFTLEDCWHTGPKIPGKTAIPYGTYSIIIDYSNRFKRLMPHILDVPDFAGIRIHSGNTAEDTEGCILVGLYRVEDRVGDSRKAFALLYPLIKNALAALQPVTITITKEEK